jgi:Fe-S cluster biogenesis protein NfuA
MADRPTTPSDPSGNPESDAQWRTAGDRIQTLLDSCAAGGAAAYERAQQLVREVVGLYGAGLERIIALAQLSDRDPALAERLATDDLVASLLLVHGLHPYDVHRRVSDALDRVRPYLGSHGGDVDLLEITDGPEGARVLLAFKGSCKSCPSSAVTLELAVEDAVRAAAPEISSIEVVTAEAKKTSRIADGARTFERARTHRLASAARGGRSAARRGRRISGCRDHGAGVPRR